MDINEKIKKNQKKNKKAQAEVNIFSDKQETNNNDQAAKLQEEEDNDDFIIQGNIVSTDVANTQNKGNVDIQKNIWEENTKEVTYSDAVPVEEEVVVKTNWGDGISKKKNIVQAVNEDELYFPDLNNPNAKKEQPKVKKEQVSKNAHLFNSSNKTEVTVSSDRFTASDVIQFKNSKNTNENKLSKWQTAGPIYNPDLEDEHNQQQQDSLNSNTADQPIKFKGKLRALGEETEADKQRALFMKEINERQHEENIKIEKKEESRYFNSKPGVNNGLKFQDNGRSDFRDTGDSGKRQFVNSKKVNAGLKAPELDPNVPTVTNNSNITAKVTLKGWE